MGDRLVRKGLVIGIIVLFIVVGIIPNITAYNNIKISDLNENDDSKINELPDLIITSVDIELEIAHNGEFYFNYGCNIKNIGKTYINIGISIYADIYKARIYKPDELYGSYKGSVDGDTLSPGETTSVWFLSTYEYHIVPNFTPLRFECQIYSKYSEQNTDNNYFNKTYLFYCFIWYFIPSLIPLPILF